MNTTTSCDPLKLLATEILADWWQRGTITAEKLYLAEDIRRRMVDDGTWGAA